MNKQFMIYTISVTNLAIEEEYECKESWETYYSIDKAISTAIGLAKDLSDDDDTYMVSVYGGEYQDKDGNTYGEPYDLYTFSNKDKETTIKVRLECGYVKREVDGYIHNGEIEFQDKNFKL